MSRPHNITRRTPRIIGTPDDSCAIEVNGHPAFDAGELIALRLFDIHGMGNMQVLLLLSRQQAAELAAELMRRI